MKTPLSSFIHGRCRLGILVAALGLLAAPAARAGLTLEMNVIRYHQYGYYFSPNLNTNSTGPSVPFGDYFVTSYGYPTNGSSASYQFTTNGFNQNGGISWGYGDFDSMMHELANGNWFIFVTNSVTTNVYHFTVTANISSNDLPYVMITFPTDGAVNVTNQPTFTWQGPTNYSDLLVYQGPNSAYLPVTQTSWLGPVLYQGINSFTAHYDSNSTTAVVSSIPRDNLSNPISSWVSTAHLQDYSYSQFTVGTVDPSGTSHTLVAHYTWDATNADGTASGVDNSGNGDNMNFGGGFGAQGGANSTTDPAAGPRAIQFHDGDGSSAGYVGWNPTPTNLLSALAGSFSISCWIKTTQNNYGWDSAPAYYGAGIVSADNAGLANDVIPIALTGSKIGFNTGGDVEDVTLNSSASVNDGIYHHIIVTRNQLTGQKIIYIDGGLDSFSSGTTNLLNAPRLLTIGALSDASIADAGTTSYYNGFDGEMDDLQIYSGVLSSNEVAQLFANPGLTANQIITVPLVARYNFEDTNSPGIDSSGNGNDSNCGSGNGGTNYDTFSTDAAVGTYAREYFGDTSICFYPNGASCFNNLSNALYGSFSWSAWVKTTNSVNTDYANAYFGAPILFEYSDGINQAVFSITGSKAAFTVGNPNGGSDTILHSTTSVNDGAYHFIAVTRNQTNGVMKVYVDGNLEATGVSTNGPRIATSTIYLAGGYYGNYKGLLDDARVYAGELSAADVAALSGHPLSDFSTALGDPNLTWATTGDTSWFVETNNTYNGAPAAAQSGSVTDYQSTTLSTTVTGPGTLTFYWSSIAEDPNGGFDYEFYIDDPSNNDIADLYGDNAWQSIQQITGGPIHIPAGQHVLGWTVFPNGDSDPAQAGFLDQVSFTPADTNAVSANITLDIYRGQDPTFGDIFIAFPSFNSVIPAGTGTTTNLVQSPNGMFKCQASEVFGGSSSWILSSLNQLINECTNGLWTLYINKGMPTERLFHFRASLSGLTTNLLSAVRIITPTNGATGVLPTGPFQWNGPTNYSSLNVSKQKTDASGYVNISLPVTTTNWPSPPVLAAGTNRLDINYASNNFPNLTFTVPVDTNDSQTVSDWVTQVNLHSTAASIFVVTGGPSPALLLNPQNNGVNFQFQFLSQAGFTHNILYRTNLVAGIWRTNSSVGGDGTLKTISIPLSIFSPSRQGFVRVSTE